MENIAKKWCYMKLIMKIIKISKDIMFIISSRSTEDYPFSFFLLKPIKYFST